jgi:hypothetical protein
MHVAVVDKGKPNKNLGWSVVGSSPSEGTDLDEFVSEIAKALSLGPLALGFEAPMYLPARNLPDDLTKARVGECVDGINRPFSAGAGAAVTVTALVVVPYVLASLRNLAPSVRATLDWRDYLRRPDGLLLFEAFVTNQKKSADTRHVEDARLAAMSLYHDVSSGVLPTSAVAESDCFNLLGAMMLRTGWTNDLRVLREECLVVRPSHNQS